MGVPLRTVSSSTQKLIVGGHLWGVEGETCGAFHSGLGSATKLVALEGPDFSEGSISSDPETFHCHVKTPLQSVSKREIFSGGRAVANVHESPLKGKTHLPCPKLTSNTLCQPAQVIFGHGGLRDPETAKEPPDRPYRRDQRLEASRSDSSPASGARLMSRQGAPHPSLARLQTLQ